MDDLMLNFVCYCSIIVYCDYCYVNGIVIGLFGNIIK